MVYYSIEAIVVGFITMVIGTVFSVFAMYTDPLFSIKKIDFWTSMFVSNFLVGVAVHLICEFSGINKWYCKNGYACKKQ